MMLAEKIIKRVLSLPKLMALMVTSLQTRSHALDRHGTAIVLILTGAVGLYLGGVQYSTWQAGVETAQVLAGIIKYPASNPTLLYHSKVWTLISQLAAILLSSGVSELTLSLVISGLMGMLFFQCLGLLVWVLSRRIWLAVFFPVVFFLYLTDVFIYIWREMGVPPRAYDSIIYPILTVNTEHTFGGISLPYVLLTFALIGGGYYSAGSFLAGLAPSVHPSMGTLCLGILTIAMFMDRHALRKQWKKILAFGLFGFFLTGFSLFIQLSAFPAPETLSIDHEINSQYLLAFIKKCDVHRQPVKLLSWGMLAHVMVICISLQWLILLNKEISDKVRLLLKAFVIVAVLSVILCILSNIPDRLPTWFLITMPGRLQNVILLAFPALLAGLIGSRMQYLRFAVLMEFYLVALIGAYLYRIRLDANIIPIVVTCAAAVMLIVSPNRGEATIDNRIGRIVNFIVTVTLGCSMVLMFQHVFLGGRVLVDDPRNGSVNMRKMFNSPVYDAARRGRGILLTSSNMYLSELFTRRPILLNGGALNQMTIAPESAPIMDRILTIVYGIDIFSDPRADSALARDAGKDLWEARAREDWLSFSREFGFTNILTYDWHLNLPVEAAGDGMILYRVE